jgi:hypothetical protein
MLQRSWVKLYMVILILYTLDYGNGTDVTLGIIRTLPWMVSFDFSVLMYLYFLIKGQVMKVNAVYLSHLLYNPTVLLIVLGPVTQTVSPQSVI